MRFERTVVAGPASLYATRTNGVDELALELVLFDGHALLIEVGSPGLGELAGKWSPKRSCARCSNGA